MAAVSAEVDSHRRHRDGQALRTAGANLLSLGVGYAVRLAVIPLSLKLLGTERYGVWLAVGSLIAWGGVADFGFSPGLINVVARASGSDDRAGVHRHVSTAFVVSAVLAVVLGSVVFTASRWQGMPTLLGIKEPGLATEAQAIILVCGLAFSLTMLTRVVPTTCTALQEGYLAAGFQIGGALLGFVLLLPFVWRGGSLLEYAIVMSISPVIAQAGLAAYVFGKRHLDLRPRVVLCSGESLRALWNFAGPLTLHQLANLGILYSANILIANRLGPAAVPEYSVPYALISVVISLPWYLVSPYLPAYAEAAARQDWQWIRRRAILALAATLAITVCGGALLVGLGTDVVRIWTGGRIGPSTGLLIALACFGVFRAASNTNGVLLTGLGMVRLAAGLYLGVAGLYIYLSWLMLPRLGIIAVPLAGAIAHLLDVGIAWPCALARTRRRTRY